MTHTANATKTILQAMPKVNENGYVTQWNVLVEFSFNGYATTFWTTADVEPTLAPDAWTLNDLWALVNVEHFSAVFESQYESVVLAPTPTEQFITDFDVNSLT